MDTEHTLTVRMLPHPKLPDEWRAEVVDERDRVILRYHAESWLKALVDAKNGALLYADRYGCTVHAPAFDADPERPAKVARQSRGHRP